MKKGLLRDPLAELKNFRRVLNDFRPLEMEREGRESVGVVHAPFDSRRFYPAEYFFFFIAGRETRDANFLGCED